MAGTSGGNRRITVGLLLLLVAATLTLFYGDVFAYSSVATFAAMLVIPFALGGLFSRMIDPAAQNSLFGCYLYPTLVIMLAAFLLWLIVGEGAVCIIMLLPVWIAAAIGGALVNRLTRRGQRQDRTDLFQSTWLIAPMILLLTEQANPPQWQDRLVAREVIVAAPAERLWPMLGSIPAIRPEEGRWTFTQDILGIPRPSDARLVTRGGKPVRLANWGASVRFEENVVALVPGRSMRWTFAFPDRSVSQYTDRHISPDGPLLKIAEGGYELAEVAPGISRLRLITKYRMRTHMAPYLGLWGEVLLGDVEANVLAIIKQRAERGR